MLLALDIPPGVYRNGTDYQSQGRWFDADLWRWHEGTMRPIGGWSMRSRDPVPGAPRAVLPWLSNGNSIWVGVGTHEGLFVMSRAGAIYDVTPGGFAAGRENARFGGGWGTGLWGRGTWGTPRDGVNAIIPASVWSLDTWGENLVGTMGGSIFEWALDTAVPAVAITGAPTAEAVLVTEERIMMALGSDGDPRAVDWTDVEDNTDWTPSAINQAGGKRLQTNGKLKAGRRLRGGILLLTDVDAHWASYEGLPIVYRFERLATGCGVVSKGGVAVADDVAYWMGTNGFWFYSGGVSPVPCDVADYVFSDINRTQISKVTAWHNSLWGEVWWHYPSADSNEVDRYVAFKYREGHWTIGTLDRLCGCDAGVVQYPLLVSSDGDVFDHEMGAEKDDREPFAESGPVEIGNGERIAHIYAVMPDQTNAGSAEFSFKAGDWPLDSLADYGPYPTASKTDCRFSGRRIAVKVTGSANDDFRIGRPRFEMKPGGKR